MRGSHGYRGNTHIIKSHKITQLNIHDQIVKIYVRRFLHQLRSDFEVCFFEGVYYCGGPIVTKSGYDRCQYCGTILTDVLVQMC